MVTRRPPLPHRTSAERMASLGMTRAASLERPVSAMASSRVVDPDNNNVVISNNNNAIDSGAAKAGARQLVSAGGVDVANALHAFQIFATAPGAARHAAFRPADRPGEADGAARVDIGPRCSTS